MKLKSSFPKKILAVVFLIMPVQTVTEKKSVQHPPMKVFKLQEPCDEYLGTSLQKIPCVNNFIAGGLNIFLNSPCYHYLKTARRISSLISSYASNLISLISCFCLSTSYEID